MPAAGPVPPSPRAGALSTPATPAQRFTAPQLTFACIACYGFSLYANGASPLAPSQTMFVFGSVRAFTLLGVVAYFFSRGAPPLQLTARVDTYGPVALVIFMNLGMVGYAMLCSDGASVATLAPMLSLYAVIPVAVGLLYRGESRTRGKLFGIAASLIATLVLASAPASTTAAPSQPSTLHPAIAIVLFLLTISCWGFGDAASAYVSRGVPIAHTAALSVLGQAIFGMAFGLIAIFNGDASASDAINARDAASLVLGNASGVLGWLCFVALGAAGGEASSFAPLVSLYVFVPTVVAILVGGERPSAAAVAGMCLGAVGGVCLARTDAAPAPAAPALAQRAAEAAPDAFTHMTSRGASAGAAGVADSEAATAQERATLSPRSLRITVNDAAAE